MPGDTEFDCGGHRDLGPREHLRRRIFLGELVKHLGCPVARETIGNDDFKIALRFLLGQNGADATFLYGCFRFCTNYDRPKLSVFYSYLLVYHVEYTDT
jgi:hypothetical protein